jgi:hypothetical protein
VPQRNSYIATKDKMLDYIVTHLFRNERTSRALFEDVILEDIESVTGLRLVPVSTIYPRSALV